jgi:predicted aldo/keto reductase-like oxidoreductase
MEYRKGPGGEPISALGYGCMRFSRKGAATDLDKAESELRAAIEGGVNYLDTAYIYPGNEVALGKILSRTGLRDKVNIATKLPQYLIKSISAAEKLFQEQLSRLQTDHIDCYLLHMLSDVASWDKLVRLGIENWIREKKESGQIRYIGFSYHGNTEMFLKLLDAYPWDFCQIQYNYMDEVSQAGRRGLEEAGRRGIPVIIMEPLRGGSLTVNLPEEAKARIAEEPGSLTPASLALRWLWDQPDVSCVLSGMHSMDMVTENVATASVSPAGCLTEAERLLIEEVKGIIAKNTKVGCTGCGYCQPCPAGVDIPGVFRCYNVSASDSRQKARTEYLQTTLMRKSPSGAFQCTGCGKCTRHCPQHIDIPAQLTEARKVLETPLYRIARRALQIFKLW